MKIATPTRESWLTQATGLLTKALFQPKGYQVPEQLRISVGFPYGRRGGKGNHAIGQCWASQASKDKHFEVFISPELDDAPRVLDVLVHEIVHASVGLEQKHGKAFKRCAVAVGLTGKMTATVAGPELKIALTDLAGNDLPPYPHAALNPGKGVGDGPKKQNTRMLKIVCEDCGWTARAAQKWIDAGLPACHCGGEIKATEGGGNDE